MPTARASTPSAAVVPERSSLGTGSSRRLSKDRKPAREAGVVVNVADLWDYLLEFATIMRVPLEEVSLMKQPLFAGDE